MFQLTNAAKMWVNRRYHCAMAKVLLIDDDRKHSELLQAYFKRFGIKLVCASVAKFARPAIFQ